jgi:hypothetical protein
VTHSREAAATADRVYRMSGHSLRLQDAGRASG